MLNKLNKAFFSMNIETMLGIALSLALIIDLIFQINPIEHVRFTSMAALILLVSGKILYEIEKLKDKKC